MPARVVAIAGAGSWGTALAILCARNGHRTMMWAHRAGHARQLDGERENRRYLPGVKFPAALAVTTELGPAVAASSVVIVAVPMTGLQAVLRSLAPALHPALHVVTACKGLETGTHRLSHEIVAATLGSVAPFAVLSGPTFAGEIAAGLPAAAVIASPRADVAQELASALHSRALRLYAGTDVVGVEVAGALKNVLAIAAGVADGLGLGANARAALITRGLAEITRLGVALGGSAQTFMGLAGIGDLVLTCTDNQSRNRRLGLALGAGRDVTAALSDIGQAVEGAATALEVGRLARRCGVEMPICAAVAALLRGESSPGQAVERLLARSPTTEMPIA
jgi:glycerol-3-phosphate dehydrogenase (NAD(P)+)